MNAESGRCISLGGRVPIIIIGGMFFCFGSLITVASIFATIKAAPHVFPFVMFVFIGGLGGGLGHIMLTRMPYETVSNDKGMNMVFLWRYEKISWDQVEWYKIGVLIGSAGVNLWIILKYRQSIEEKKTCSRISVMLLQSLGSFEGFSSENYTFIFDKYVPHKRIRRWHQVFRKTARVYP